MRIAHVTATFPPYWGGTGNVAFHNARVLHERGHQVTVFTSAPAGQRPLSFPFPVEYLPAVFRVGNAPMTPELVRRVRGFDVIHLHYPYIFGGELVTLALKRNGAPLIVTYHNDLLSPGWKGIAFRAYSRINQRYILSRAARLVATSEEYARHSLLARCKAGQKVCAIPNGVDIRRFVPAAAKDGGFLTRYGLRADRPVALFVGAMDRAHFFKGVPVLLEAARRLPEVQVALVGDGDLRAAFAEMVPQEDRARVRFAGSVPLADLISFYQSAEVTVLPSLTMGEAFGVVLIESMACGTPVIASDLPGVRTVVEEGVDGFLHPPGDAGALAGTIRRLLYEVDRKGFGQAGRAKTERQYAWDVIGERLERLYREVVP